MRSRVFALLGLVCAVALAFAAHLGREAWIARKLANLAGFNAAPNKCFGAEPASEAQQRRLYIVGDSIADEWPLDRFDASYEAVQCGMTGETTAQLEQRFDRFDFLRPGDVVVITAGIYDAVGAAFAPAERTTDLATQATERLHRLALLARDNGGRVMVTTVLPPGEPEAFRLPFWRESIRDFTEKANAALRGQDWKDIGLLDIARLVGGDDRQTPSIWMRNGLKLNPQGYATLTAEINRRLAAP
jgi:hypothetical protein